VLIFLLIAVRVVSATAGWVFRDARARGLPVRKALTWAVLSSQEWPLLLLLYRRVPPAVCVATTSARHRLDAGRRMRKALVAAISLVVAPDTPHAESRRAPRRFVAEKIARAGQVARLADPAETAAERGSKRRAKTDRADCDLQLKLLLAGELPESWIPPVHILELRTRVRTRKTLDAPDSPASDLGKSAILSQRAIT
jgi:hypothetical protein